MEMNATMLETIKELVESRAQESSAAKITKNVMRHRPSEYDGTGGSLGLEDWLKSLAGEKENYGDLPKTGSNFLPEKKSFSQHLAQTQFSDGSNFIGDYCSGLNQLSCRIEFDGASKGNPGLSGAGAILRVAGGSEVWRMREGVGIATNNVVEYKALILGLRTALQKGFKHVRVTGDSLLVCNQVQGIWKINNENIANLCKEALALKKQFASFVIEHVPRELNSDADALANQAINLLDGQVEMEVTRYFGSSCFNSLRPCLDRVN